MCICENQMRATYTATLSQKDESDSVGDLLAHKQITRTNVQGMLTDLHLDWIDLFAKVLLCS